MKKFAISLALLGATSSLVQAADFMAGRDAYIRGDFQIAYKEFMPLAQKGDAKSRVGVGLLYAKGQGVKQNDVEAHRWFTLAADQKPRPNVFVRTVADENRKVLAKRMSPVQIAKARRLAEATETTRQGDLIIANSDDTSPEALEQLAAAAGSPPAPAPALSLPPAPVPTPPVTAAKPTSLVPPAPKAPAVKPPEAPALPTVKAPAPPPLPKVAAPEPPKAPDTRAPIRRVLTMQAAPLTPVPVERQELPAAAQPAYLTKTILPSSRNGRTTTIGVIPANPPTTVITSPNAAPAPAKARPAAQPVQTAALTPAALGTGQRVVLIQLGAYKNSPRAIAERAWQRINQRHGDLIGAKEAVIVQADLGAKGVYQRLRTGPYASFGEAKGVCDRLRSRNQRCYVVRGRM